MCIRDSAGSVEKAIRRLSTRLDERFQDHDEAIQRLSKAQLELRTQTETITRQIEEIESL